MRTAIVYDRVNKWGGAERVLLSLHEMFPDAPLYTSVYDEKNAPWAKVFPDIKTSFLQKIPFAKTNHEFLAPLMPLAFESFDFSDFDLVISVTSEAAKGIRTKPGTYHLCYCLTPTRYLWSHRKEYFDSIILKTIAKPFIKYLKRWDLVASGRPDKIIGISSVVSGRIKKYYKRDSMIIYPPAGFENEAPHHKRLSIFSQASSGAESLRSENASLIRGLTPGVFAKGDKMFVPELKTRKQGKYYLIVSRLVKYKKVGLAVKAFNVLKKTLVIVGSGREEKSLKSIARKNIKFAGQVTEQDLPGYYKNAIALIMPQEEDFGIVSVEAQSLGIPVIAYKKGGATDTVISGKTGLFFESQTPESLIDAVTRFEKIAFVVDNLLSNAKKFDKQSFKKQVARFL